MMTLIAESSSVNTIPVDFKGNDLRSWSISVVQARMKRRPIRPFGLGRKPIQVQLTRAKERPS
jgi:hypothetical protein